MRAAIIGALVMGALAAGAPAAGEVLHFRAVLTGAAETPPNVGRGTGLAEITLDTDSRMLAWRVTYAGLTGPVTGAHFRTPPEPGSALGSTMDFARPLVSPILSSARLNDIEIGDLRAGLWSVNLLTAKYPAGEIRGDLERVPATPSAMARAPRTR